MLFRRLPVAAMIVALGSCAAPQAPAPVPEQPVRVPVAVTPPPLAADWRDWPLTPGDWRYAPTAGGSVAQFGAGAMTLTCDRATRTVALGLVGGGTAATVRTSSTARTLALTEQSTRAAVALAANDPLLDAMGFSRGRFVIQRAGLPPLVVPAWPEILRVAEDCRG